MADEEPKEAPKCYSIQEYMLFKLDRTIAIIGVVAIVALFSFGKVPPDSKEIALSALAVLGVYIGARGGK